MALAACAARAERVVLQLKWYPQFQFAGYYMAQARGYYRDERLDVVIRPGWPTVRSADEVIAGRAQFGVAGVDLLERCAQGQRLTSLAAIMQHSAAGIMVRPASPIRALTDLAGRRLEVMRGSPDDMELRVALRAEGVNPARVVYVAPTPGFGAFLRDQVDAQAIYITNEPNRLRRAGVPVRVLTALSAGIDFYGDCLFTAEDLAHRSPDLVARFRRASLRGWREALNHPDDAIQVLLAVQSPEFPLDAVQLRAEAAEMRRLIQPDVIGMGHQNPERWQRIEDLLRQEGLLARPVDIDEFIWRYVPPGPEVGRLRVLYYAALAALVVLLLVYIVVVPRLRSRVRKTSEALAVAQGDLAARGRALHALLELSTSLSAGGADQALMASVMRHVASGLGHEWACIHLNTEAGDALGDGMRVGADGAVLECPLAGAGLDDVDSPLVRLARGDEEISVRAPGGPNDYQVAVPLKSGGRVLGVLAAGPRSGGGPAGEAEARQLKGVADEIALALTNAQLVRHSEEQQERLASSNRQLQALLAFSRAANAARTLDEVVRLIAATVREGFGFDRVGVFLTEGDEVRGMLGTDDEGNDEEGSQHRFPAPVGEPGDRWTPVLNGAADYLYTTDAYRETGFRTDRGRPVRHHVEVPLRTHGRFLGFIAADNAISGRPFSEAEVQSLLPLARHAASAIENVGLVAALSASEEQLRGLLGSLSETVYALVVEDGRLRPVFLSPQLELLTGYTPDEGLQLGAGLWERIVHPDDLPRVAQARSDLIQALPSTVEYRVVDREDTVRWVLDTPMPVRDDAGRVVGVNGTLLDITERKHLEEQLRQAQKMETVGTLAGGVAHDFNNLLAIISGNIEMAEMDLPEGSPAAHSLAQTRRAVDRAAALTQQLLTFSRKTETARVRVSLRQIVEETLPLLKPSLQSKSAAREPISLDLRLDADTSDVVADPGQIQQVLINLCVNARDAILDARESGRARPGPDLIAIRTQNVTVRQTDRSRPPHAPTGDYVRLQIRDTGGGIDSAAQGRLFEPFFTTKPVGQGTGLGLAVAYAIVSEHRGWIDVRSAPGRGAVFSVYLPVADAPLAPPLPPPPSEPMAVLVVDPDPAFRERVAGLLERHACVSLTAAGASDGLAVYWTEADQVGLVLCGPGIDDVEAVQFVGHIRAYDGAAAIVLVRRPRQGRGPVPQIDDVTVCGCDEDAIVAAVLEAMSAPQAVAAR